MWSIWDIIYIWYIIYAQYINASFAFCGQMPHLLSSFVAASASLLAQVMEYLAEPEFLAQDGRVASSSFCSLEPSWTFACLLPRKRAKKTSRKCRMETNQCKRVQIQELHHFDLWRFNYLKQKLRLQWMVWDRVDRFHEVEQHVWFTSCLDHFRSLKPLKFSIRTTGKDALALWSNIMRLAVQHVPGQSTSE